MDYRPPSFRQPRQYDIPKSIDDIFNAYQQSKDRQQAAGRQDFADTMQFGAPINQMSPDQLQRGAAGPTMTPGAPEMLARTPADAIPQAQFDEDPHVSAIQRRVLENRKSRELGQQKDSLGLDLTRSQIEGNKAKAANDFAEAATRGLPNGKEQLNTENSLRDELNKLSGPFIQVRDSYGRIQEAARNPSAAGDLALIFNYMKVLDPGSTVREGEFATAQNAAGVPDRLIAHYNKIINGERLAPDQRQDFVSRAEDLYRSQERIQKQQEKHYGEIAKRSGARPENVVFDRSLPAQPAAAASGDMASQAAAILAKRRGR